MRTQRFFPTVAVTGETVKPFGFAFDSCCGVLEEYPKRLPLMAELVKAMSIAELEADGRYNEAKHDPLFEGHDENSLRAQDLAMFPDYLVHLKRREKSVAADAPLMELLSSGIPAKVLVQVDDILEKASVGQGRFPFGMRSVQLASTAVGLTETFVLQSSSSNLLQLRDRIQAGMEHAGSSLFSVFSGAAAGGDGLPAYLVSAAAMQSRAFPAFTYDPNAGPDLASRFCLEDNPQPDAAWPVTTFEYADADLQRVSEPLGFTLADFIACDPRYAKHFARVTRLGWNDAMVPVAEWLAREDGEPGSEVPYLLAVDESNVLHRVIVDDKIIQAARRGADNWRRLQELGGINNSYAERLLAREKAAWEEAKQKEIAALSVGQARPAAIDAPLATAAEPAPVAEEPARSPDEPHIETIRCSTCNECTNINNEMFTYNEDQQAYIADLKAGTYRQMIEAAESCQLAIIHPGKPWDPKEPGLDDLLKRAASFD
jgi:ferredoxin